MSGLRDLSGATRRDSLPGALSALRLTRQNGVLARVLDKLPTEVATARLDDIVQLSKRALQLLDLMSDDSRLVHVLEQLIDQEALVERMTEQGVLPAPLAARWANQAARRRKSRFKLWQQGDSPPEGPAQVISFPMQLGRKPRGHQQPPPGPPAEPNVDSGWLIRNMVVLCESERTLGYLVEALSPLGAGLLRYVYDYGARIVVVPCGVPVTEISVDHRLVLGRGTRTFDGRDWKIVRGFYSDNERLIVVGEERLDIDADTARHEFGHAFDFAWQRRNGRMLSKLLLGGCASRRRGFLSWYAESRALEYWAVSFAAWFRGLERARLGYLDPLLCGYIEHLVGVSRSRVDGSLDEQP
jgi:hypothetical protein